MIMTGHQALTVDYRTESWGEPPYNGATAYRPDFDAWLAGTGRADAGAALLCSTTATGLLRDGDRVVGVRTDRPDGDLTADVVIACDGVNSFLAKEAGLYGDGRRRQLHRRGQGDHRPAPRRDRRAVRRPGRPRRRLSRSSAAPATCPAAGSSTPTSTRSASGVVLYAARAGRGRDPPGGAAAPHEGPPRRRAARGGWRGQGVLGPRHPRGRLRHDARAGRRRAAGGRRRRRHVPGRGHLAGGRELRHRVRRPGRAGRGTRPSAAATRPAPAWPATARRLESSFVLAGPPQAARRPPPGACPTWSSSSYPPWPATWWSACSGWTTPTPSRALRRILRSEMKPTASASGTRVSQGLRALRTFG